MKKSTLMFNDKKEDYVSFLQHQVNCNHIRKKFKSIIKTPKELGHGYFHRLVPRDGLEIWKVCNTFKQDFSYNYSVNSQLLEVLYCREGHCKIRSKDSTILLNNNSYCIRLIKHPGEILLNKEVPQEFISIVYHKCFFDNQCYPLLNIELLPNKIIEKLRYSFKANKELEILFESFFKTDFLKIDQPLIPESKALEILSMIINLHLTPCIEESKSPRDLDLLEKIALAKSIIKNNPEKKINIPELSKTVALNSFKLTKGFKEQYNKTINNYRTEVRMRMAETLLTDGYSVSETSYRVGYMDISHFIKVFKREFGIFPSEYC